LSWLEAPPNRNSRKQGFLSGFRETEFFVISLPLHLISESTSFSANRAQRPASVLTGAPVMAVSLWIDVGIGSNAGLIQL
jgi:hypothetical protein